MTIKEEQRIKVNFPLSKYFQQLFSPDIYVKFINPFSFWRRYRINHLETCWAIDIVQRLERCRQLDSLPTRLPLDYASIKASGKIGTYRSVPWEKTARNTILINQPSFELKYRGITYRTNNIRAINTNKAKIKPGLVASDCSKTLAISRVTGDASNDAELSN